MKIVLAELRNDALLPEKSFDSAIIRIGRDVNDCQIAFDSGEFPMVSRRHAELRRENDNWILHDLNSSYGTFLNGRKISQPHVVQIGSRLEFGASGPVLIAVRFESAAAAAAPPNLSSPESDARLEFADRVYFPKPFQLAQNSVWLGRDPAGAVVFDANAVMVSRRHAEIRRVNGDFFIHDNGTFNGTLVNEQRISMPTPLFHNDQIELGLGGPILTFIAPSKPAPKNSRGTRPPPHSVQPPADSIADHSKTMVVNLRDLTLSDREKKSDAQPTLRQSLTFGDKNELIVGRDEHSDIRLDGLQISNRHARLTRNNAGVSIEDQNSTNGVYINGSRIARQILTANDAAQIGSFLIRVDDAGNVGVFDTRAKTRIDALNITKEVKNRAGGGTIRLLDDVSLSVQPNEFIGLLGPSGAGKSTLMDALNGMRPASGGSVLINNLDLYQHLDSLKQSIGYVPQDDIIHRELTVYRTLFYVAKLRLSSDVSRAEINRVIEEVLDVTGLSERRDVPISQLSGGQRKRVSIAVELITKPSLIFLDEPTSGLDPATEEKIMKLFRQIAESGRTVILTTHAMENVKLFDKIVVLMRGKLAFYGTPDEALNHLGAKSFKELYDKLEEPVERAVSQTPTADRRQITEQIAEEWKRKFTNTAQFKNNISEPLKNLGKIQSAGVQKTNRLGLFGSIRQFAMLARRYREVLFRDKLNLFILLAQAPIIALMVYFVMGANQPRDFAYFVLSLVAVWFGISISAREIIRERVIYKRERMVNLGLLPYVGSKLFVLGIIVGAQCLLLFVPLKLLDFTGLMPLPGELFGVPQFWVMLLTAAVGIALGLFVSALVKTSEMATSLVPLILIPQILFSGLVGVPSGIGKPIGMLMPATWAFDTMKRFSTLDTLEPEGAEPNGATDGKGLYDFTEAENDRVIADAKRDLNDYKKDSETKLKDFQDDLRAGKNVSAPTLNQPPPISEAVKIPENLSSYVNFLHPWMSEILNQVVLMLMFLMLVLATLIVLRFQDIG